MISTLNREETKTQTICMKSSLLDLIKKEAEENGRKISTEIVRRIEKTFREEGKII